MSLAIESGARVGLHAGQMAAMTLRSLDSRPTDPPVHSKPLDGPKTPAAPRFDAADLYGKGGPTARDIEQDSLGDCYFVATLGALANQRPELIRDAISYDPKSGNFQVKLHIDGREVSTTVTQSELEYNLQRQGGSTVDNTTGKDGPIWPAVMETAYAKVLDSNPADGLKEGFDKLGAGGKARDALEVVTGDRGDDLTFSKGWFESQGDAVDRLGRQAEAALANGRPLTLSTDPESRSLMDRLRGREGKQDGLVDNHVYVVEKVAKVDGEYMVTLRNPWATNTGVNEGKDSSSPTITVKLSDLVETGGLEYFNAGPAG